MDKATYRELQRSWLRWDRSTALGCAQRKRDYDPEQCERNRMAHLALIDRIQVRGPDW